MISKEIGYNRIYARVDIDSIRFNVMQMKALVKPDMKVLAVIKADAYGHGASILAKHLEDLTDYYGVASVDEAVELRMAGIKKPILIIGHTDSADYIKLLQYDITQAVDDVSACRLLSELAMSQNKTAKVHIKVDTGMSRIGFMASEDGVLEAAKLFSMPGLHVEGIFTHYARADETDKTFANIQKQRFLDFIDGLRRMGYEPSVKHIDNSAGTMEFADDEFDMVRLGIVMYGLYPSEEVTHDIKLKPAMSLVSHVAHVKTLPANVGISYGGTFVTNKDTRVATVTAGYADGYPRAQSNIGNVLIHGCFAPILGRVCMDQFMVDVTDIPGVTVGDDVILIGACGDKRISVEEVAEPANSFNYELVCNISRRVPRVYALNGKDICCVNYLL
ncbi:MAG: alanine racemase [Eubacteriales bacterium]|nr:alanine racemase [Lachnospiraceae bacterium]MDO5127873.1 alanine racemase [Eubacteriales bacterium]